MKQDTCITFSMVHISGGINYYTQMHNCLASHSLELEYEQLRAMAYFVIFFDAMKFFIIVLRFTLYIPQLPYH